MHGNVELKTILLIRCSLLSVKGQEVQSLEDLDEKKKHSELQNQPERMNVIACVLSETLSCA